MAIEQAVHFGCSDWYALFVRTGAERSIQNKLNNLDFDLLRFHVPCREMRLRQNGRWVMDLQPMFPGYILVSGAINNNSYAKVRQLTDVYTWICDEHGPLHIHPEEVAAIRRLTDHEDVIRLSRVMYEGQRISIVEGPLMGQEAIIRKVDRRKGRVKIALTVFGEEKLVDVSVEDVEGHPNRVAYT